ncbi:MAG: HEAT repeat domain-containing protein [Proteobacteria bacterium]|nr:HEAT repeat domain-containing protein [Pseudomonadota bacterium]
MQGSLPFLFFKDGMRELRFMEGIEEWEIKGLADIIIQRDNINEFEDDLITLIWEKDFIHISYLATDQFLEETPVLIPETWYLVRNLVYILGRIGQEASMPYIQKSYNHSESRVRREAVQAAGLIGGPRATALLTRALKDQDLRIRSMAGISLARVGKKASLPALLEVIQTKDFSKRDPYEVKAFFEAVGSVGSNEAVQPLQQILEHKGWFGGEVKDKVRLGAACSLALIGTPEAKAVLQSGANSREESIRQACLEAKRRYGV